MTSPAHGTPPTGVRSPRRRLVRLAVAGLAVLLSVVACGGGGGGEAQTGADTGLVVATSQLPMAFGTDGAAANNIMSLEYGLNTQARLLRNPYVQVGDHLEQDLTRFEGVLAESYEVSPDGLTYTFHLRRDVRSVVGNPLTADDVVWSYERKFANPASPAPSIMASVITDPRNQVRKVDDHTVTFTIAQPGYGATLLSLSASAIGSIYDSTELKANATPADPYAIDWSYSNFRYGFGAYYRSGYTAGQQLVLSANPNYVFGEPAIKTITYQVVAAAGTRANGLRSGDIGFAEQLTPADQAALIADDVAFVPTVEKPNNFLILSFNTTNPTLANPAVRQAFGYAVPYDQITGGVYHGRAVQTPGFLASTPSATGEVPYTYDPDRARSLLASAGHPNGVRLSVAVSNGNPDIVAAVVQIRDAARAAGFDITLDEQPPAQFGQTTFTGQYEVFAFNNFAINLTPQYELNLFLGPQSALNYSKWTNAEFSALYTQGLSFRDQFGPEAGSAFSRAERIALDQAPMLWAARIQPTVALGNGYTGWALRNDNMADFSMMSPTP